jgi:3-hydroxyacyl-CoA dehydrogenase/enoyl-CoA hydratase/3-hydroxybutyryl-CoA epimerase
MTPFQTVNLRLEQFVPDTVFLWLDVAERNVNVFNRQVLADLDRALDHVAANPAVHVLVIRSAKPSGFIAGADLNEFAVVQGSQDAVALSERGQRLFDKLAKLPQTTIAVINGPCLGGGLEFALACDYRLVADQPKTQLGLPEVELGLLPGWGGTQRLPRIVGLERALRMILSARRLNAKEALLDGLADALASSDGEISGELETLKRRVLAQGKRPKRGLTLRTWRQRLLESHALGRSLLFRGATGTLKQRVPDDMPAPWEALKAVQTGIKHGIEAGLAYEREAIGRLAMTPACHNLVNLFFQREKARKLPAEVRADLVTPIQRVGIVGAGSMGAGIAQLAAVKGFEVVVQEVNDAALNAGMKKIEDLFGKAVANRVLPAEEAQRKLAGIRRTTTWDGFGDADLVIEAVIEDLELKRDVFHEAERRTKPTAFLLTNTSSLLVERLQEGRDRPGRVGGLHFFNPVHKMPLVEVVRGPATDEATVATLTQWAIDLGKVPVVVKDSPGFLVNRVLMPYLNEAALLVTDGWHREARLDQVARRFGMPVGPLELLDQVGLDVTAHIARAMRPLVGERIPISPIFAAMVGRGFLGQKSGQGFYRYRGGRKTSNRDVIFVLTNEAPLDDLDLTPDELVVREACDRLILPMVNEAAMCLSEGIVATAEQLDAAMVFGSGWAPLRGGPLHYADACGLAELVRVLDAMQEKLGPRFAPCGELRRRAETGESFFQSPAEVVQASVRAVDKVTI